MIVIIVRCNRTDREKSSKCLSFERQIVQCVIFKSNDARGSLTERRNIVFKKQM